MGLGCVLAIIHVVREVRCTRSPDLAALVQLVLAASGISAGVRVGFVSVTERDLGPFNADERIYSSSAHSH